MSFRGWIYEGPHGEKLHGDGHSVESNGELLEYFEKERQITDAMREFSEERQRQLDADPQHGLLPSPRLGWQCPNCGSAHGPDVATCPDPDKTHIK